MTPISDLTLATTSEDVKRIENKYLNILPACQKNRLQMLCKNAVKRIERINKPA